MGGMVNYTLRIPDEMYEQIKTAAERDRRSIHAEMLWLIEQQLHGLTPP
jgi:hypothetical protein